MAEMSANSFRANLKAAVDRCVGSHEPLKVKRRNGEDFVVIGADDWAAIEETLYLNRFPGLVESIHEASREPLTEGTALKDLDW